jgi:transmembrane sensor
MSRKLPLPPADTAMQRALAQVMGSDLQAQVHLSRARTAFLAYAQKRSEDIAQSPVVEPPAQRYSAPLSRSRFLSTNKRALTTLALLAAAAGFAALARMRAPEASDSTRTESLAFRIGELRAEGRVGDRIDAALAPIPLRFNDGTVVTVAPNAAARVLSVSPFGAGVLLEQGQATLHVVHRNAKTAWSVSAGPFDVDVTGTQFDISWDRVTSTLRIRLDEGSVLVHGCGTPQTAVRTGETLVRRCADAQHAKQRETVNSGSLRDSDSDVSNRAADRGATSGAAVALDEVADRPSTPMQRPPVNPAGAQRLSAADSPNSATPSRNLATTPSMHDAGSHSGSEEPEWVQAYRRGDYEHAFQAAWPTFDATCGAGQASELLTLGHVARLSAHPRDASIALERLRTRFPHSREAMLAAFYLGTLAFDGGAYEAAVAQFERCLSEDGRQEISREARGRILDAWTRLGNRPLAVAAAHEYLRVFPNGPDAAKANKLLETSP